MSEKSQLDLEWEALMIKVQDDMDQVSECSELLANDINDDPLYHSDEINKPVKQIEYSEDKQIIDGKEVSGLNGYKDKDGQIRGGYGDTGYKQPDTGYVQQKSRRRAVKSYIIDANSQDDSPTPVKLLPLPGRRGNTPSKE
jgi:hypothetical protein